MRLTVIGHWLTSICLSEPLRHKALELDGHLLISTQFQLVFGKGIRPPHWLYFSQGRLLRKTSCFIAALGQQMFIFDGCCITDWHGQDSIDWRQFIITSWVVINRSKMSERWSYGDITLISSFMVEDQSNCFTIIFTKHEWMTFWKTEIMLSSHCCLWTHSRLFKGRQSTCVTTLLCVCRECQHQNTRWAHIVSTSRTIALWVEHVLENTTSILCFVIFWQ